MLRKLCVILYFVSYVLGYFLYTGTFAIACVILLSIPLLSPTNWEDFHLSFRKHGLQTNRLSLILLLTFCHTVYRLLPQPNPDYTPLSNMGHALLATFIASVYLVLCMAVSEKMRK